MTLDFYLEDLRELPVDTVGLLKRLVKEQNRELS